MKNPVAMRKNLVLAEFYSRLNDFFTEWHDGEPPSCGWWPASGFQSPGVYRWWNGKHWSASAAEANSAFVAAKQAAIPAYGTLAIQYQHRPLAWPARSFT